MFLGADSYAESIAGSGVDIFLTANNHILDKGREGIERTLGIYSRMEKEGRVRHTGAAVSAMDDSLRFPLKVVSKGIRLAFINFTYGTNCGIKEAFPKVHRIDTVEIAGAIQRAKESGADFIVALPHWGAEYVLRHSASQERLARWLAGKGCDAVIGGAPTCASEHDNDDRAKREKHAAGSGGIFIGQLHLQHERPEHSDRDDGDTAFHKGLAWEQEYA